MSKITLQYDVFSNSPLYLAVMDMSDWAYAENQPAYLKITLPGSKNPLKYTFKKEKTNIFNSHNLGITCLRGNCKEEIYKDLPDGIYTIELLSNYSNVFEKKYYLKSDRFEVEYKKVLVKYKTDVDQNFIDYMYRVKYTLDVAKSFTAEGNIVESHKYFQEAKKLLKRYVECNDCL